MHEASDSLVFRGPVPVWSCRDAGIMAMPARISCVSIDALDPRTVVGFWAAVLGWEVVEDGDEAMTLASPGREQPTLGIFPVPEGPGCELKWSSPTGVWNAGKPVLKVVLGRNLFGASSRRCSAAARWI